MSNAELIASRIFARLVFPFFSTPVRFTERRKLMCGGYLCTLVINLTDVCITCLSYDEALVY